jgi:hypothetical protein
MDTTESLDTTIALLQDQVVELQARIRGLQTRRNALVPLGRLPDEILLYILEIMAHADRYDPKFASLPSPHTWWSAIESPAKWPHIMGVCTRMRSLALQNAHLWTHINLNAHDGWVELCLERSHVCPLTVSFNEHRMLDTGLYPRKSKFSDQLLTFLEQSFTRIIPL